MGDWLVVQYLSELYWFIIMVTLWTGAAGNGGVGSTERNRHLYPKQELSRRLEWMPAEIHELFHAMIEQTQVQTLSELRVESVSVISSVCEQVPTHWTIPILTVVVGLRFELAIRRQSHLHELMSLYVDVAKENYQLCMVGRLVGCPWG